MLLASIVHDFILGLRSEIRKLKGQKKIKKERNSLLGVSFIIFNEEKNSGGKCPPIHA
jgi:hypothetical protein